jgi:uncharacterized protein DUF4112
MGRVTRMPHGGRQARDALAEVETMAWLLDSSIPVPGTGGRRIGADAIVGLVPVVGDLLSAGVGLFVVWRGSRVGLPRVVVARMLANSMIDLAVGAIPVVGDAFDLWFKANTRNLALMRRHLESPGASTTRESVSLLILLGFVVLACGLVIWLLVALLTTELG